MTLFRFLVGALLLVAVGSVFAMPAQTRFVVGTEDLSFYPHYDFTTNSRKGFANELLEKFAHQHGYHFRFQPLPVKRLYHELDNIVDFIYPDNPAWHSFQGTLATRLYSEPLIYNLGTTLVKPGQQQIGLSHIRTLAIVRGFTPVQWLNLQQKHKFKIVEVATPQSAVSLVLRGQLDAADVEYNVAYHLLNQLQQPDGLVVASKLPFSQVGFHLSTTRHASVLKQFNRFLADNPLMLAEMKLRYGLLEQLPQPELIE